MTPKSPFEINWPLWAILSYFAQPMRRKVLSVLFFFLFSRKKDDSLASAERSMARSVKRMSAESAQILCMTNVDTYAYKAARGSLAPRRRTAELKRRAGYSCGGAHGVSNSCSNLEKSRLKKQEKASRPSACRLWRRRRRTVGSGQVTVGQLGCSEIHSPKRPAAADYAGQPECKKSWLGHMTLQV